MKERKNEREKEGKREIMKERKRKKERGINALLQAKNSQTWTSAV